MSKSKCEEAMRRARKKRKIQFDQGVYADGWRDGVEALLRHAIKNRRSLKGVMGAGVSIRALRYWITAEQKDKNKLLKLVEGEK